ncbi:Flp/Fap pilin component [Pseudarthrobacter chlorophenolicus A6]|uniref:Flp/Fap pilin component n=1 Tax=Pseudarthrobacter chlorophenolicus (strain ATCC 700700 / DSM 12829 / CIP 107037 / JCM 12360 / KCTC 9906 / NCIMB 13794 / A6) TaxID=452863 RepID=B8HCJ1_PSECP|nr:Flp family type IVb pilin [Pseudarthrobacter chlorophenolicus]ACL40607.1 Flp/Fap pilin component [Pseudarthrobacter chlorophenolicus A6]SDQ78426.1 pilus assembly protein Flp/PilA [Pseudarthrobacter chlorophenolicus]
MIRKSSSTIGVALRTFRHFNRSEKGATATEYGILVAFLAFALVLGVSAFGQALNLHYQDMTSDLRTALGIP